MSKSGGGLSFGIKRSAKNSNSHANPQVSAAPAEKQFITGVSESNPVLLNAQNEPEIGEKIIPKLENTFQVGTGKASFVPTFIPEENSVRKIENGEDKFEAAVEDPKDQEPVKYGLNLRSDDGQIENGVKERDSIGKNGKMKRKGGNWMEQESQMYKEDMEQLPEAADLEAYEAMPVEDFGRALLRGMDWKEGQALGRNKEKAVEVVEFIPRDNRLGLGAKPSMLISHDKKRRRRQKKEDLVLPPDADGRIRHVKKLDEQLVPRESLGPVKGKMMKIIEGRHSGLKCEVIEIIPKEEGRSERARVRLLVNDEAITLRTRELGELNQNMRGENDGGNYSVRDSKKESSAGKRDRGSDRHRRRDNKEEILDDDVDHKQYKKSPKRANRNGDDPIPSASWLFGGIRVRVIDKRLAKGKHYLKKGTVADVLRPGIANVVMDDSKQVLEAVSESSLETVVPKREGLLVLVLNGQYKGQRAKLLHRKSDSGTAAVQMLEDLSIQRVLLDDIAEYMGLGDEF